MFTITRRLEFDAGHRVYQHESKCSNVHGHRYKIDLTCSASELDELGRIIDFGVIKQLCGGWLDDNFDHGMILYKHDPLKRLWESFGRHELGLGDFTSYGNHKFYLMDTNPTAENIAQHLYQIFQSLLDQYHITVVNVRVWETPNCYADYTE
tara:strand:- start:213 stop:668 length:456 start_codon:yes stop_codon:yes gene_type:complete